MHEGLKPCTYSMELLHATKEAKGTTGIENLDKFLSTAKQQTFAIIDDLFVRGMRVYKVIRKKAGRNDVDCAYVKFGDLTLYGQCGYVPSMFVKLDAACHFSYREMYNIETGAPISNPAKLNVRFWYANTSTGMFDIV